MLFVQLLSLITLVDAVLAPLGDENLGHLLNPLFLSNEGSLVGGGLVVDIILPSSVVLFHSCHQSRSMY